ncbi:MAG: response regulator transcription factor [Muribaculaceae bacterium]|nr:response regulator transcription factor [Muribaculaceae bacterium]
MSDLKRILIVDENPKSLVKVLPMYGYDVVSVPDCVRASACLESENPFDMVLSELALPKISGLEFLKNLRKSEQYSHIPFIFVTEEDDVKKMVQCLNFGADDYITKPYALPNLLARMAAVLRRVKPSQNDLLPNVTNKQKTAVNSLTAREKDVLLLVTRGLDNSAIAKELYVSIITVKAHLQSIFKKLNVKNRTQAVLFAIDAGLISKEK